MTAPNRNRRPDGTGTAARPDGRSDAPQATAAAAPAHVGPSLLDHLEDLEAEDGRRRRDAGTTLARTATHTGWRLMAERVLDELADAGEPFTADDLRRRVGHPLGSSPNAMGALLSHAARRGRIRALGFVQSTRPERHGGWVRQWIGTGVGDG